MKLNKDKVMMLVLSAYKHDPRPRRQAEALVEAGNHVDVICIDLDKSPVREVVGGVNIFRMRPWCFTSKNKLAYLFNYVVLFFASFFTLTAKFLREKPAKIVIHNMPNHLVFTAVIAKIFGARIVLDLHDPTPELYETMFQSNKGLLYRLLLIEEKISCRFAHHLITVNEVFAQRVKERVNRDLFVVLNAPDVQWLKGDDRPRNENGKVTLYHHGNIHHRCGIDRILPALKTLLDENLPVEVEVHGGGPFLAEVERVANDLKVSDHCTFGGRYPSEELAKRMENADIGLVTNRTSPFATLCMPIKLLEYVECKLPVICTRMETANYYFDETMVYFFDDESEIPALVKRIMNNPAEVKSKTEKAYAKYQEITWAAQKPKYQTFIQNA
ncbi:MAG: glycosyltransferase [Algicola sp.]|nr:glycosyltransferase [Algicola sp.]